MLCGLGKATKFEDFAQEMTFANRIYVSNKPSNVAWVEQNHDKADAMLKATACCLPTEHYL